MAIQVEYAQLRQSLDSLWFKATSYLLSGRDCPADLIKQIEEAHAKSRGLEWELTRRRDKTLDYILEQGVVKYRKLMEKRPWKSHR